ncbi:MAG TPA: 2-oxo acid dehydrogenase subunit E2 [Burkholderiaceae bacterium]|nr:2-oxo acid dehydrogenase subunit E2 [Burkholderiaceae bacterium]
MSPVPAPGAPIPLKGLRGSIARNVSAGWLAPQVAMGIDVEMTRCLALAEERQKAGNGQRVTMTAVILRALALALRAHPRLNASITEAGVELAGSVNLGLAVALEDGLMVPVIRNADAKSIEELAAESRDFADGARRGRLPPKAYQGGSFTLSNLGPAGIDWFTPILNPPQVAILGIGRVAERVVYRAGAIRAVPMMTAVVVFDHRAVDGDPAARFLKHLCDRLESADGL